MDNLTLIDRACRESKVGKLTPAALYVHMDALADMPVALREYEERARLCVGTAGPPEATLVKLHRLQPTVSYLYYPDFETDAHPALATSVVVHLLRKARITRRDYSLSANPPILHRKELFVPPMHPHRDVFEVLTAQEEAAGLYEQTATIGTRKGWQAILKAHGVRIVGHKLVSDKSRSPMSAKVR
jgi:DNA phosphorothioation-associated putative methyltransferase